MLHKLFSFNVETAVPFVNAKFWIKLSSCFQDKKGISGKQIPTERRTIYQRHIRPSTMLAKSILEGKDGGEWKSCLILCVRWFSGSCCPFLYLPRLDMLPVEQRLRLTSVIFCFFQVFILFLTQTQNLKSILLRFFFKKYIKTFF